MVARGKGSTLVALVYVCTHDSCEFSFANADVATGGVPPRLKRHAGGWAQRGPVDLPQSLVDEYEAATSALRRVGHLIEQALDAAGVDE